MDWPGSAKARKLESSKAQKLESSKIVKILPKGTQCARRSTSDKALNDNREREEPYGWFTYILNEEEVDEASREKYFEEKLQGYETQHDDEGRSTLRHTKLFQYKLQKEVRLYDMTNPHTISYLGEELSKKSTKVYSPVSFLEKAFKINENGKVERNSELNNDRDLFYHLCKNNLVNEIIPGWLHDDMNIVGDGVHRREAVILNPSEYFLIPPEDDDGYFTP